MQEQRLAPNETIQLHELLTMQNLSLTKCITMSPLVQDDDLKNILKTNIMAMQENVRELRNYMDDEMRTAI